jgi:hypothetical protein
MPFKKILYILIFCSFILPFGLLNAQIKDQIRPLSNEEIFENELKKSLRTIEDKLVIYGKDKFYNFRINSSEQIKDFFINGIRRYLGDYKITTGDSTTADYFLDIKKIEPGITYKDSNSDIFLNKKVIRNLVLTINYDITERSRNEKIFSDVLKETYSDEIGYDRLNEAEMSVYDFTKGELPGQTLLQKLLIPGIVVITSAVAIVLFFIVRSK